MKKDKNMDENDETIMDYLYDEVKYNESDRYDDFLKDDVKTFTDELDDILDTFQE